jgi:DNA polymerase-1
MKYVKIKSITKLEEKEQVYDIETEIDHSFFGNNIAIHNSSNPNGQNFPKHGEEGKIFRKIFKCPENYLIGEADFSGFQLRIAAILSGDKVMEDIFINKGADIHALNSVSIFCRNMTIDEFLKVKNEEPYKTFRYKAKNQFSFPLLFSSSAYVIYGTIKNEWNEQELKDYISENNLEISKDRNDQNDLILTVINDIYKKYFETYPELKQWINKQSVVAEEQGYTDSIHGCRRHLPRLVHPGTGLNREELSKITNLKNISVNSQVQSFEFIEVCRALIEIDKQMVEKNLKSQLVGMVHDSIVLYIHKNEIEIMYDIIMKGMNSNEYSIPILGELTLGEIWGFGKEVTKKNINEFIKN